MPPKGKQKASTAATGAPGSNTLIVDNGGHTIKAGFLTQTPNPTTDCHTIPNCISRSSERSNNIYIADQLLKCKDTSEMSFRRPVDKGFIVSWDGEHDIWKHVFFNDGARLYCDPHDTNIVLAEAPNCPAALQTATDQMLFEEFEFASAVRCLGASLNSWNDVAGVMGYSTGSTPAECMILIDSGYSCTTVTPVLFGRPVQSAIRRLEVGGKMMTNLLKELASLRHWNLMDDSYLVSQIKEDACFVSLDFDGDLDKVWKAKGVKARPSDIIREYVLPDYRTTFRGYLKTANSTGMDDTSLPLGNERFVVPELLFRPSDIGLGQAGLPEIIVQSLNCLPPGLWPGLLANIVVVGGNAKIPGLVQKLETELRIITPSECAVRVRAPKDPITFTWLGGARMASDPACLKGAVVTRQEYQEQGAVYTARKFAAGINYSMRPYEPEGRAWIALSPKMDRRGSSCYFIVHVHTQLLSQMGKKR